MRLISVNIGLPQEVRALALGLQKLGEGDPVLLRRTLEIPSLAPLLRRDLEARLTALTAD